MKEFNRYLITAALPYANGPVHIGHLAGCYIPADIYVRYLRANNKDVKFVGGTWCSYYHTGDERKCKPTGNS